MMRSVSLMLAFPVGVFVCVIPGLSGGKLLMPLTGLYFATIGVRSSVMPRLARVRTSGSGTRRRR